MEQYIKKSALVAEINQRIEDYKSHKIDDSYHDGLIFALEDLRDDFIDTLEVKEVQEEPVSIWHDAQTEQPQAKKKILATNEYGACEVDYAINMALYWLKVIKWAYIEDLLNLSNVERTTKNWKEPVSEGLEEASKNYALNNTPWDDCKDEIQESFKAGAMWQKANLWKSADGEDLPEYEREVVVFTQNFPNDAGIMSVAIGHRPNPDGWNGKSLSTGKVEHFTPKTYGKGGWNIPDVVLWLDYDINELLCREK